MLSWRPFRPESDAGGKRFARHKEFSPRNPFMAYTNTAYVSDSWRKYVNSKTWLSVEFVALFIGFPAAFHTVLRTYSPVPFLVIFGLVAAFYLFKSKDYDNQYFYDLKATIAQLPRMLIIFSASAVVISIFVCVKYPEYLFYCPKNHFSVWVPIMWSYPLLAVYPQEIIYRGFLFQRYGPLFSKQSYLIHASALVFSFGHIIYYHPLSMLLTLAGGYLFAYTYWKSKSLLAASIEHALYGCFLYTIGLGRFFLSGIDQLLH